MENDYKKKMKSISILGIYVADLAFFGKSIPVADSATGSNDSAWPDRRAAL